MDVFRTHREVCPVHAVVQLIVLLGSLVAIAEFALELEKIPAFFGLVLSSFEHVVALGAKSNTLELGGVLLFWL